MLAIKNATILTVTKGVMDKGTILIEKGKIVALGENLTLPERAEVIDASGKFVCPGFVDAHTALGLKEDATRWEGADHNENTNPTVPHMRALDGFNPEDLALGDAREAGVTTALVSPGAVNVLGGIAQIFKTATANTADALYVKDFGLKAALGEEVKQAYGAAKKMPSTRMGTAAVLREALYSAKSYIEKRENPEKAPELDLKHEALVGVLKGELPLIVHAHRADDMHTAVRIAKEFGLRLVFTPGTEAHKLVETLAELDIPVIIGAGSQARMRVETGARSIKTAGVLAAHKVKFAISTDHPSTPISLVPFAAGLTVRGGLCPEEALKAITIYPAEILGLADRVGSLETGKDADILILNGHPLKLQSKVVTTIINGKVEFRA